MSVSKRVPVWHVIWRNGLLLCGTVWWGGLSFYAMFVVPIGTELIGSSEQGAITQQVTRWHNGIFCVFLILCWIEALRRRQTQLMVCGSLLSVTLVGLFYWHQRLTSLMSQQHSDAQAFYREHAMYLWMTTIEWGVGLLTMGILFTDPHSREETADHTPLRSGPESLAAQ